VATLARITFPVVAALAAALVLAPAPAQAAPAPDLVACPDNNIWDGLPCLG
jgi:hypothetical protein